MMDDDRGEDDDGWQLMIPVIKTWNQ